jgi:hypothetical protein
MFLTVAEFDPTSSAMASGFCTRRKSGVGAIRSNRYFGGHRQSRTELLKAARRSTILGTGAVRIVADIEMWRGPKWNIGDGFSSMELLCS